MESSDYLRLQKENFDYILGGIMYQVISLNQLLMLIEKPRSMYQHRSQLVENTVRVLDYVHEKQNMSIRRSSQ